MYQKGELGSAFEWLGKKYLGNYSLDVDAEATKREIRKRLFSEVNEILSTAAQTSLPVDVVAVARLRKAEVKLLKLSSCKSLLLPRNGGFTIKVDSDLPLFKERVAIAHELGHTFFYDLSLDPPQRVYSYKGSKYWEEHGFAFEIAREILLPTAIFEKLVRSSYQHASLRALRELSKKCEVSYDILRLKLVNDLKLWDCVIFRSEVKGEEVRTKRRDISKGQSYRNLHIPQLMCSETKGFGELCNAILSVMEKKTVENDVLVQKEKYGLQVALLPPSSALTLLQKA
jgi:hypothetical protein